MAAVTDTFWTDLKVNLTPDTVDIRTSSTVNNYGERTFTGSVTTYDAHIRRVTRADRGDRNDLADVDWIVTIPDDTISVAVDDEVTLPAPVSAIRPIMRVDIRKDPTGQVGAILYIGRTTR